MQKTILDEIRNLKSLLLDRYPDHWLNIKQAANFCNLSISTIRRFVQSGQLKCSKKTGKLLFKKSALDQWLNNSNG